MRSALAVDQNTQKRSEASLPLLDRYLEVRRATERMCAPLSPEDQMVQSMPDASPTKWHQAHTSWFFETFLLLPHLTGYRPLDEKYTFFFNSYYKQLGGHPVRAQRGLWSRPSLEQVRQYRHHVDENMLRLLEGELSEELARLVVLGLNHEQQHQELILTDIKYALWTNPLRPAYRECGAKSLEVDTPNMDWVDFPGGEHYIGHEGEGFAFDNETPRHRILVDNFRVGSRLITNGEYLEFMADRGYRRPELWLSDGWDAVNANEWVAPLYWETRDGEWRVFTLNGEKAVNLAEPVCNVSFYEADAFARWAGRRLPTEFEWELAAADHSPLPSDESPFNLLESDRLHPAAAGRGTAPSLHEHGVQQLFGDVWEWTASPYVAYPGFRPAAGVLGEYNGKFMCNQMVLRGGSCATPTSHIRATYRNFFPPHARWQFSGIRLAQ